MKDQSKLAPKFIQTMSFQSYLNYVCMNYRRFYIIFTSSASLIGLKKLKSFFVDNIIQRDSHYVDVRP